MVGFLSYDGALRGANASCLRLRWVFPFLALQLSFEFGQTGCPCPPGGSFLMPSLFSFLASLLRLPAGLIRLDHCSVHGMDTPTEMEKSARFHLNLKKRFIVGVECCFPLTTGVVDVASSE
jgi:hypothetical protein